MRDAVRRLIEEILRRHLRASIEMKVDEIQKRIDEARAVKGRACGVPGCDALTLPFGANHFTLYCWKHMTQDMEPPNA